MNDLDAVDEIIEDDNETEIQTDNEVEDRALSHGEDVELDVREAFEALKGSASEEEPEGSVEKKADGREASDRQHEDKLKNNGLGSHYDKLKPKVLGEKTEVIQPPASWKVEAKEWFNAQPIEAKRELSRRVADHERKFTIITQELQAEKRKYSEIEKAIEPYREQWHLSGVDETRAIRSLAAADAMLKKDFEGGMSMLAKMKGMTLRQLADKIEGQNGANTSQSQPDFNNIANPHLLNLESKVRELEERLLSEQREKERTAIDSALNDLYELRDETDAYGRYLRPELHDNETVSKLVPLVEGLSLSFPNEKPRELLLRAYTAYTGKPAIQTRVPQNNHVENAKKASLSVRGSPSGVAMPKKSEVPDSVEDTAMMIARQMGII